MQNSPRMREARHAKATAHQCCLKNCKSKSSRSGGILKLPRNACHVCPARLLLTWLWETRWAGETKAQLLSKFRSQEDSDFYSPAEKLDAYLSVLGFYVRDFLLCFLRWHFSLLFVCGKASKIIIRAGDELLSSLAHLNSRRTVATPLRPISATPAQTFPSTP